MREREDGRVKRVVASVDFSAYDLAVVGVAEEVCRVDPARLDILHVFYPPWLSDISKGAQSGEAFEEREYRALLQSRLDKLVPTGSGDSGNELEVLTVVSESARHFEGILRHIRKSGADLAVIGSRVRSRIESMNLGRIAERIVMNSSSSVYVVKNMS